VLDCIVGGDESPEFLRQSRMMADHWGQPTALKRATNRCPASTISPFWNPLFDPDSTPW
jgi:arylformamidase